MRAEAPSEAMSVRGSASAGRPPVRAVTVLMPVWGYRFVSQFLEFCLPTLLAPGNVPAVAATLPCRFVLLSSEADEPLIRSHPAWQALARICAAEIHRIDDLITDGNHTATITLAFARAVRQAGDAMTDTCFIFLVSDYLVADGSLRSVVERVRQGASGVVAGNFQIVAEDAIPAFRRRIGPGSTAIVLPPRELMSWSLAHLHPATVANMVNFGLSHNAHTNRLFWRVDESTLIGRFYLMHMIGIRPEVTDFVVGASCDYSFIPEMCPSGNVVALTDSDDYLVVEMQPRDHEAKHLLPGPIEPRALADSLSEWTTAQHRSNVANTLVYHAGEIPAGLAQARSQADAFIDTVRGMLSAEPHPFRHHHYWIGSLASNRAQTRRPLSKADWHFLLGEAAPRGGVAATLWRLRAKLFGSPPDVTRLHPRWPDYGLPLAALKKIIAGNGRTLLVASQPATFARWLTRSAGDIVTLESDRLLDPDRDLYVPLIGQFDACLMIVSEAMMPRVDALIAHASPLLKPGGQIMIMISNERGLAMADDFSRTFVRHSARLLDLAAWVTEIRYIPASRMRWAVYRALRRVQQAGDTVGWRSPTRLALLAVAAGPLAIAAFLANLGTRATATPPRGLWSSVFLLLRPSAGEQHPSLPPFGVERESAERPASAARGALARARPTAEEIGLGSAKLSPATAWHHDPIGLAQVLARYHVVANLLNPRHDIAEYGCAESLGTAIVLRKVRRIAIYDPDLIVIADLHCNFPDKRPFAASAHDILSGPLPTLHDSIYSLDFIQHISRSDEDTFIANLRASLRRDRDVLIIGSSASDRVESSPTDGNGETILRSDAASADAAPELGRHGVRRSAAELRALLERHFHVVFSFSMINEVLHPGILCAADYALAVCCHRKQVT